MIKSRLEIIDKDTVIQHRRLVTPFFYVNLKAKTWKHSRYDSRYLTIGSSSVLLPGNKTVSYSYWKNKDMHPSYKLSKQMDELIKPLEPDYKQAIDKGMKALDRIQSSTAKQLEWLSCH